MKEAAEAEANNDTATQANATGRAFLELSELDPRDFMQASMIKYDGGNPSDSRFSISLTDWTEKGMEFLVKFQKPLYIS